MDHVHREPDEEVMLGIMQNMLASIAAGWRIRAVLISCTASELPQKLSELAQLGFAASPLWEVAQVEDASGPLQWLVLEFQLKDGETEESYLERLRSVGKVTLLESLPYPRTKG